MTTLTDEQILEIASEYQTVVPGNCLYIVEFARALLSASKPAAQPVAVYPQGVMGIPPYSPPGSGSMTVEPGISWNAAAPSDGEPVARGEVDVDQAKAVWKEWLELRGTDIDFKSHKAAIELVRHAMGHATPVVDAKAKASEFMVAARHATMFQDARELISTLTDPNAKCPGRHIEAQRVLPLLDTFLGQGYTGRVIAFKRAAEALAEPQPSPTAVVLDERATRDAVTREQIDAWAKLAGINLWTEQDFERLGDFAIFARQARAASPQPVAQPVEQTRALTDERIDWIANAHCPGGTAWPSNVKAAIRDALNEARAARPASGETE